MLGGTQGPQEHSSPGGGGDKNRNCAPTAAEEDLCGRPVWAKAEAAMQITAVQRNSGRAAGLLVKSSAPGLVCLGSCSSSAPSSRFLLMWTLGRQPGTSQGVRSPPPSGQTWIQFPVPGSGPGSAPAETCSISAQAPSKMQSPGEQVSAAGEAGGHSGVGGAVSSVPHLLDAQ